jgi:hypothetical protein
MECGNDAQKIHSEISGGMFGSCGRRRLAGKEGRTAPIRTRRQDKILSRLSEADGRRF